MILKKRTPGAGLPSSTCPHPGGGGGGGGGAIYMSILPCYSKIFFSETVWPIKAKRLVEYS